MKKLFPFKFILLFVFLVIGAVCFNLRDHLLWKKQQLQNFTIYYKPDSYAQNHLQEAMNLYEKSYQHAFAFVPESKHKNIKLYLYDELELLGFSRYDDQSVHYVFSEKFQLISSHEFMHLFLKDFNPKAPVRLEEGLCRVNEARSHAVNGEVKVIPLYVMGKLSPQIQWHLQYVFLDHYQNDQEGNLAAAFVNFYLDSWGQASFWSFYRDVTMDNWQALLEKRTQVSIEKIDNDFADFVSQL